VSAVGGPYAVNGIGQVALGAVLRNIIVMGNVFMNQNISDTARTSDAIAISNGAGIKISDNIIYGFPGRAVYLVHELGGTNEVTDNHITWCGYGGSTHVAIELASSDIGGTMDTVIVADNSITTLGSFTLGTGILCSLLATKGYIGGNQIVGATTEVNCTVGGYAGVSYTLPKTAGFTDTGAPHALCTYRKSKDGIVTIEGQLTCAAVTAGTTVIATLPAGFRPVSGRIVSPGYNLSTEAALAYNVETTGTIIPRAAVAASGIVSLAGIAFRAS
jgi:hypothetical protein